MKLSLIYQTSQNESEKNLLPFVDGNTILAQRGGVNKMNH